MKKRVLYIEDDVDIQEFVKEYVAFRKSSLDLEVAANGKAGIEKLKKGNYSAVLTDIKMPIKDGAEVLKWLAKEKPGIKTAVYTGMNTHANFDWTFIKDNCDIMVEKPHSMDKIFDYFEEE